MGEDNTTAEHSGESEALPMNGGTLNDDEAYKKSHKFWRNYWGYYVLQIGNIFCSSIASDDPPKPADSENAFGRLKELILDFFSSFKKVLQAIIYLLLTNVWLSYRINCYRKLLIDNLANSDNFRRFREAKDRYFSADIASQDALDCDPLSIVSHEFHLRAARSVSPSGTYPWTNSGFNSKTDEDQLEVLKNACQRYVENNIKILYPRVEQTLRELYPDYASNQQKLFVFYRNDLDDIIVWLFDGAIKQVMEKEEKEISEDKEKEIQKIKDRKEMIRKDIEVREHPAAVRSNSSDPHADPGVAENRSRNADGETATTGSAPSTGAGNSERRAE